MPMKPFDAFDEDVATSVAGFLAHEVNELISFFVADEECGITGRTFGHAKGVCVLDLMRMKGEQRRYRVTIEREK